MSRLLKTVESMRQEWDGDGGSIRNSSPNSNGSIVGKQDGEDFLFLFDLLAHSCGLESTLRVLTHSDDKFYEICKPRFDIKDNLTLEEDKLKVRPIIKCNN